MVLSAGQFMAWLHTMSHNFIHQPNNWRMYATNMMLVGWRDWRVFHAIVRKFYSFLAVLMIFASTVTSLVPKLLERLRGNFYGAFRLLDANRQEVKAPNFNFLLCFPAVFYGFSQGLRFEVRKHSFYVLTEISICRYLGVLVSNLQKFHWDEFVSLLLPLAMFFLSDQSFTFFAVLEVFTVWTCIVMTGSFFFNVHAVAASHHAPPMTHEGDEFRSCDFGIYQLGSVFDRHETNSNLFMTLAFFGYHSLHHMFPSLDHSLLPQLEEVFIKTCIDFEVELKKFSFYEGFEGHFQQLGRTKITKIRTY